MGLRRERCSTGPVSHTAIGLALAAFALTPAACGEGSDEEQIRAAVDELQTAFAERDLEGACATMTAAAQEHIRGLGHDKRPSCAAGLRLVYPSWRKGAKVRRGHVAAIASVTVRGSRATVTMLVASQARARVPFAREDGEWRIDALYGGIPAVRQEDKL